MILEVEKQNKMVNIIYEYESKQLLLKVINLKRDNVSLFRLNIQGRCVSINRKLLKKKKYFFLNLI